MLYANRARRSKDNLTDTIGDSAWAGPAEQVIFLFARNCIDLKWPDGARDEQPSMPGLPLKNPDGFRVKPVDSTGMTGKSSGRTM